MKLKKYWEVFLFSLKSQINFLPDYIFSLVSFGIFIFIFNNLWEYILAGKEIVGYMVLKTNDNKNFTLDFVISRAYEYMFSELVNYAISQIKKRTQNFNFYVINRYYLQSAGFVEEVLREKGFEGANSSSILVKDLFRIIKNENSISQTVFYTNMSSNPAFDSLK